MAIIFHIWYPKKTVPERYWKNVGKILEKYQYRNIEKMAIFGRICWGVYFERFRAEIRSYGARPWRITTGLRYCSGKTGALFQSSQHVTSSNATTRKHICKLQCWIMCRSHFGFFMVFLTLGNANCLEVSRLQHWFLGIRYESPTCCEDWRARKVFHHGRAEGAAPSNKIRIQLCWEIIQLIMSFSLSCSRAGTTSRTSSTCKGSSTQGACTIMIDGCGAHGFFDWSRLQHIKSTAYISWVAGCEWSSHSCGAGWSAWRWAKAGRDFNPSINIW